MNQATMLCLKNTYETHTIPRFKCVKSYGLVKLKLSPFQKAGPEFEHQPSVSKRCGGQVISNRQTGAELKVSSLHLPGYYPSVPAPTGNYFFLSSSVLIFAMMNLPPLD
jgi:hypothetical protein